MSELVVPSAHGPIDAVLETPDGYGPWPGVVIIHDALGLTDDVRSHAQRIAAQGYLALAPNLYARGGALRCIVGVFRELFAQRGKAFDDVCAARDLLTARPDCTGPVGVVGFCMGGGFALLLASKGFAASAPFYGKLPRNLDHDLRGACPIVASYGRRDPALIGAGRKLEASLARLGIPHDVKTYPDAGHSFTNMLPAQPLLRITGFGYDEEASQDAWRRTFAFFAEHLNPSRS